MGLNRFYFGFLVACVLWGCAGATFGFKYYGMQFVDFPQGKLLGERPSEDQDFAKCANNGCVVMFSKEFYDMKKEFIDNKNSLSWYQRYCKGR